MSKNQPPPPNYNNPGGGANPNTNNGRLPSAWQPTAPTSTMQAAATGQPYYPPPPQAYQQQQQQYHHNPYYAAQGNPYYVAQRQYYPQPPVRPQQLQPQAPAYQPPARERKALVITDKQGNPIDLAIGKKAPSTSSKAPAAPSADAGNKMREMALARIAEAEAAKKGDAAKKEEEAKKKAEEEAAAASKKAEEEEAAAAAAAAKKKAEEEEAAAKKKAEEEAAAKKKAEEEAAAKAEEEAKRKAEAAAAAQPKGKRRVYSKTDLLRFRDLEVCCCRPEGLPDMTIERGPSRGGNASGGGGGGGGGGGRREGSQWTRGSAPPNRRPSTNQPQPPQAGGGGKWARGQAPPPQQKNNNVKGGRGGNRGSYEEPSMDFKPLVKSDNRWKPKKNADALVMAEKSVKSILNKMTKEKFDRLSQQLCEIPLESYEYLNMMIRLVYNKAIDEPSFGDMYADLCSLLSVSAQKQTSSFVQIFESDEEMENGSPVVWRWSNDVSHNDGEIVGPFEDEDDALEAALADETMEPIERGDMELALVSLRIKDGTFVKILKKVPKEDDDDSKEDQFYVVFFPLEQAEDCGQTMSSFFLTERECRSDASKNNSFKRSLLNQCQDEFNKQDIYEDWKKEKAAYLESKSTLTDAEQAEKEEELEFRRIKIKKQMIGNIKFIGQLYKKGLLKEKIMRHCIGSLLKLEVDKTRECKDLEYKDSGNYDLDDEDHEALCNMFATIGKTIDTPAAAHFMDVCFKKMSKLSDDTRFNSRSRFMYKDLIELRANRWEPRRQQEKAKTLDEIRKDVEREERLQAQQSQQQFGGGGRGGGGRGGGSSRGIGRGMDRGSSDRRPTNDMGRSRSSGQKPHKPTDSDGFTTITRGGAVSSSTSRFTNTGTTRRVNSSPPRAVTPSRGGGDVSSLRAASSPTRSPPRAAAAGPEPLSKEKLERRIKNIRAEYMQDPKNIDELLLSFDELAGTPQSGFTFVCQNTDRIMDCNDAEREAIITMFTILHEKKKLSKEDIGNGVADVVEFLDSFILDSPRAYEYAGDLISSLLDVGAVGIGWVCEQTGKIMAGDAAERTVKETMVAYVRKFSKAKAQGVFGDGADKLADLLGNDKWNSLASSVLA